MRYLLCMIPVLLAAQSAPEPLFVAIHNNDLTAVRAALKAGANVNTPDEIGATPLMHAGAYCSLDCMGILLAAGAKVNAASNAGFTPLMWSIFDPKKLKLLLERGAEVKARAKDGNTALILARQNGITDAGPILLRAGAADEDGMDDKSRPTIQISRDQLLQQRSVGVEAMHMVKLTTPMTLAVFAQGGQAAPVKAILDAGADANEPSQWVTLRLAPLAFAAYFGNSGQVRELLNRGANPNSAGLRGLTPLMAAAGADYPNPEIIALLLAKGAEINSKDDDGRTALDWALLQGETSAAGQLRKVGGRSLFTAAAVPAAVVSPRSAADAIQKAVEILQPIGTNFFKTSGGCISCHNNSLPGLALRKAAERNARVDAAIVNHDEKAAISTWKPMRENFAVGASAFGGVIANISYELTAMAETAYPRNDTTDAAALALLRLQQSDGSFSEADLRPPLGIGDIKYTALTVRSLKAYLPPGLRAERDAAVSAARAYLIKAKPRTTQDEVFRVLGLLWCGEAKPAVTALLKLQRQDGGWSQVPTMASDAYATGQALFALQSAGVQVGGQAYRRGAEYLLRTQLPDGSWFVQSRAIGFQPYRETGFPHGRSQFISAAATSWAVIGLAPATVGLE